MKSGGCLAVENGKRPTPLYLYIGGENPETGGFEGKNELYFQGAALPPGKGSGGGL